MKTYIIVAFLLAATATANSQDKYANSYICQKGKIHFFASTPIEDIVATSDKALCVLNTDSKKVYAKVTMTTFEFKQKLMQEHFNENYIESDKYPDGTLDAVIEESLDLTKDGVYDITLKGTFEVHGVKQPREIKGKLTIKNGQVQNATATFDVKLADHQIKIPTALLAKIAEVVKVDIDFNFEKYQKK